MEKWSYNRIEQLPIQIIDGDRGANYPKQTDFYNEGYCLFLNTGNVTKEGFDFSSVYFISKNKDEQLRKGKLKRNDIVITTRGTLGNVGYYSENIKFQNIRINSGMIILRVDEDELHSKFLYQIFKSSLAKAQSELYSSGTAQPQLPIQDFRKIKILIPPLPIQQRIASILSAYDDLIEVNNQRIKLLEETARELYKEWFVRMRFPGYKNAKFVKGVPEAWEVVRLDNVLSFKTGKLNSNASTLDGQYPFFTCSNADFKTDTYSFDTEAVLLAGNNAAGIYPLKYYKGKFDAYQRTYIIKPKSDDISHKYVYYYFLERLEFLQTISIGAATQFLTTQMLKKLLIFLPNKNLMELFSIIVDPIFEQVQILNQQNTQLRQIRDKLLPRLISGKLEVKEK